MRNAGGIETNCDKVLGSLDTTKRKWQKTLFDERTGRAKEWRLTAISGITGPVDSVTAIKMNVKGAANW